MAPDLPRVAKTIRDAATKDLWRAIEGVAVPVTLPKGGALFREGDDGESLYIIRSGEIEISVLSESGRKLALNMLTEDDVLGEIALFGSDRTATATALSDCELSSVHRADVMATIRKDPDLALDFINLLCERLRWVSGQLGERAFLPVSARLARRLLFLDEKLGGSDGKIQVSQAELADFVGATRESIAKTLSIWRQAGWVSATRGSISVTDKEALEELAELEIE